MTNYSENSEDYYQRLAAEFQSRIGILASNYETQIVIINANHKMLSEKYEKKIEELTELIKTLGGDVSV